VQLLSQLRCQRQDLGRRVVVMFEHFLPGIAVPAVLARLDISVERAERVLAQAQAQAQGRVPGQGQVPGQSQMPGQGQGPEQGRVQEGAVPTQVSSGA
jgi:hypothetical protein